MRRVQSRGRARPFWLMIVILALGVVAIVDVDGDPTTSNVPTFVVSADRDAYDTAVEVSHAPGLRMPIASGDLTQIPRFLPRLRSLWASRSRSIRGP